MDIPAYALHYPTMIQQHRLKTLAGETLYGESPSRSIEFRFHCETLFARSSLHRFEIDLHRHDTFVQLLYISTGDGDALLNGSVEPICPPAVIVVPPSFEHGFRFSRDIGGVIVTALPSALQASVQALLLSRLNRPALIPFSGHPDLAMINTGFARISREHANPTPGWDALCEGQIATIFALVARTAPSADTSVVQDISIRRFETLLALIAAHIRDMPPSEFYAQRLGISQTHLNRLVRAKAGISLQRLIARRQIEIAQQELLFTVLPARTVAADLGFTDPAYFSRFFLRETGTTPQRWREAEREKLSRVST